jgi:hypothetical protein
MAIHINRITVGTPTGLTPALSAGGSLAIGTTYYYRVITVRWYASAVLVFSAPCAEVSVTPDASNRTVALTWDATADAYGYIVQRSTVSGSYPVDGYNSFRLNGQNYSSELTCTTQTTLTDDGGAALNVRFDNANLDLSREIPALECYGDSVSDVVTLADLLAADRAGGWGDLSVIGPAGLAASTNATWLEEAPYLLLGSLYSRYCTFRLKGMLFTMNGLPYFKSDGKMELGHATSPYMPYLFHLSPRMLNYTNNGNTWAGMLQFKKNLDGVAGSFIKHLVSRPIKAGNAEIFRYGNPGEAIGANVAVEESIAGLKADGGLSYSILSGKNNIFESIGITCPVPVQDLKVRFANWGIAWSYCANAKVVRCQVTESGYDMTIFDKTGGCDVDGTWQSKGQTDNQPYLACNLTAGRSHIRCNTFKIKLTDIDGNPISGATVQLIDALGNPGFSIDSLATWQTNLNATDVTTNISVSDGTKFSVGDIIRYETYAELLQVTAINGNTLTVTRGYGGTAKRATDTNYYNANKRLMKQVASLSTDTDGEVLAPEPLVVKELTPGSGTWYGYEDDLVAAGSIIRNMRTPHTLTITKDGYQDYQEVVTIDRPMDLEVALLAAVSGGSVSPVNPGLAPLGVKQVIV